MIDREALESRLRGWAQEYGGGKYENIGYQSRNMLQTLIEHGGFVPDSRGFIPVPIRSAADEVESAVAVVESGELVRLTEKVPKTVGMTDVYRLPGGGAMPWHSTLDSTLKSQRRGLASLL